MSIVTLRPGLLVSLSARMYGGVEYNRVDLDAEAPEEGAEIERWETTKVIADLEEHKRAAKVRGKCRSLVRGVCTYSAFGLLCPASKEKALDEAIAEARKLAKAFNATATTTRVEVYALKGRIADSDTEASRAISGEMRDLIAEMREGIAQTDVGRIREAAAKARRLGGMLDAATGERIKAAVDEARAVAKDIVKRLVDDPDSVAGYVQAVKLESLESARFAFLDMDAPEVVEGAAPVVAEVSALDLEDDLNDGRDSDGSVGDMARRSEASAGGIDPAEAAAS